MGRGKSFGPKVGIGESGDINVLSYVYVSEFFPTPYELPLLND